VRRPIVLAGAAAIGALLAAAALLWSAPLWLIDRLASRHPGCLFRAVTAEPVVALTIDDGPDPASTRSILAELRRYQARATFFLIAERVVGREALVREIVRDGHEVGNHFTRDRPSIRLPPDSFEADLLRARRVLAPFGGTGWARPASGWYSPGMVATMRRHGYRCALGSVYPYDASVPSTVFAAAFILENAHPGAVLVLHDGGARGRRTAVVLRRVLPELRRRGYRVVGLSDLPGIGRPNPASRPGSRAID
jgi:peptidoglycan/xylan/chitin deacetylase (PgdA/CDA1 family)